MLRCSRLFRLFLVSFRCAITATRRPSYPSGIPAFLISILHYRSFEESRQSINEIIQFRVLEICCLCSARYPDPSLLPSSLPLLSSYSLPSQPICPLPSFLFAFDLSHWILPFLPCYYFDRYVTSRHVSFLDDCFFWNFLPPFPERCASRRAPPQSVTPCPATFPSSLSFPSSPSLVFIFSAPNSPSFHHPLPSLLPSRPSLLPFLPFPFLPLPSLFPAFPAFPFPAPVLRLPFPAFPSSAFPFPASLPGLSLLTVIHEPGCSSGCCMIQWQIRFCHKANSFQLTPSALQFP
eukprot:NODE_993_length_1181_cov_14.669611_g754_i0.p1 GENE.NODE_993_length_1181_cov_14.669611_g754_i0~~NODE_993_length_1181_cov_14.669611_g754_i0.p1  ORF type:complete len:292 (+),score=35.51 NODE_993_length_1181_cov_14.669611_g754_i0:293-1168(+)